MRQLQKTSLNNDKLERLKAENWQAGYAADFLTLSDEDARLLDEHAGVRKPGAWSDKQKRCPMQGLTQIASEKGNVVCYKYRPDPNDVRWQLPGIRG